MGRLIDADALVKWIHFNVPGDTQDALFTKSLVQAAILTKSITPTVEAVPLKPLTWWLVALPHVFPPDMPDGTYTRKEVADMWEKLLREMDWEETDD